MAYFQYIDERAYHSCSDVEGDSWHTQSELKQTSRILDQDLHHEAGNASFCPMFDFVVQLPHFEMVHQLQMELKGNMRLAQFVVWHKFQKFPISIETNLSKLRGLVTMMCKKTLNDFSGRLHSGHWKNKSVASSQIFNEQIATITI